MNIGGAARDNKRRAGAGSLRRERLTPEFRMKLAAENTGMVGNGGGLRVEWLWKCLSTHRAPARSHLRRGSWNFGIRDLLAALRMNHILGNILLIFDAERAKRLQETFRIGSADTRSPVEIRACWA